MNSIIAAMPGGMELVVIVGVILLFFGGSKLPALARGLGQSVKEFKKGARDENEAEPKPADAKAIEGKQ
jgi:sec-independent protein translocase protein TatA